LHKHNYIYFGGKVYGGDGILGIYEKLGVRKVINAAGTWTILGGSIMSKEVLNAMVEAAQSFVDMVELHKRAGEIIAEITGAEAGLVTTGAAGGLVLAAAACMTGTDPAKIEQLPDTEGLKNEIIVQAGHRNPYDNCLRIAGAKLKYVGCKEQTLPEEIENTINEKTAAIAFFIRAHSESVGQVPLTEVIRIAKKHEVPTIVDASAELPPPENLRKFVAMGADLVTFSGGKAIGGPNATGILCGRRDLIEAAFLNSYIAFEAMGYRNIGRAMKVGRESIIGLLIALQKYVKRDHETEFKSWNAKVNYIIEELKDQPHVKAKRIIGNSSTLRIPYAQLTVNEKALGTTVKDIVDALKKGEPSIWVSYDKDKILINSSNLVENEEKIVAKRIKEILNTGA